MLVFAAVSAIGPTGARAACAGAETKPRQVALKQARAAILCLLNHERTSRGLRPVSENKQAFRAATKHNLRMVQHRCFAHQCYGEKDLVGRLTDSGYLPCDCTWRVGENLAWGETVNGTPRAIVDAWMASPEHRENVLNPSFRQIGIGTAWGSPYPGHDDASTYTTVFGVRR